MKFWIGVNSDGSEIISKRPIKRYISLEANYHDVLCYDDNKRPPHWMLDYSGYKIENKFDVPIDVYITLPAGSLKRMFGVEMGWDDEFQNIEL